MCRNYVSEHVRTLECLLEFLFHKVVLLASVLSFCGVYELATLFQEIFCVLLFFLYSVKCN